MIKKTQQNTTSNTQIPRFNLSTQMANDLLDDLRETLVVGFSDEAWWRASDIVSRLSTCLSDRTDRMVKDVWREMYTHPNTNTLDASILSIKERIKFENDNSLARSSF